MNDFWQMVVFELLSVLFEAACVSRPFSLSLWGSGFQIICVSKGTNKTI